MGQAIQSKLNSWNLDLVKVVMLLGLFATLVLQWGGLQRDSAQQLTMAGEIAALQTAANDEQRAREALEQALKNLESRGAERTARRDADIAALAGRIGTLEGKTATMQIDLVRSLSELTADVRAIKEWMTRDRASQGSSSAARPG